MVIMKKAVILLLLVFSTVPVFAHKARWDDNKINWSPLMLAIYNGQTKIFTKLIAQDSNLNYCPDTSSYLHLTALNIAVRMDDEASVRALLTTKKIQHPESDLMEACSRNNSSINNILIVEMLLKYGANPNDTLFNGYSVLMSAASFGTPEALECLLKHAASVKYRRAIDGITPLMLAAFSGSPQKVKLLLDYGADKYILDKNGDSALSFVEQTYPSLKISEAAKTELTELRELLK